LRLALWLGVLLCISLRVLLVLVHVSSVALLWRLVLVLVLLRAWGAGQMNFNGSLLLVFC